MRVQITNTGGEAEDSTGGVVVMGGNSSAGDAAITNEGAAMRGASGGSTTFEECAGAMRVQIAKCGGDAGDVAGGVTVMRGNSSAGDAAITNEGAAMRGASGG